MYKRLASILLISSSVATQLTYADTATNGDSHRSGAVDPTAPIAALDQLTSLKQTKPLSVTLPKIIHFTTDSGTPVALVQARNLPIVDVSIYFNAGSARDEVIKKGGYGIASMTASMLDQGTTSKSEDEIAETSEQLGIALSANAYKDMFIVSLRSLSDDAHLSQAIGLMRDIISHPTFPAANVERTKAQYLISLQQAEENPDSIAGKAFAQALYGDHPYAHPAQGSKDSIGKITASDLHAFRQQFLVAHNANIAITGDISVEQAHALANQLTRQLPLGTAAPKLPDAKPLTTAKTLHIPFNSSQTTVIMGQLGQKRASDATSLQRQTNFAIADEIVGGGNFQARLMEEIRKKRGLTYGIYSGTTPMLSQGSYTISFSTRNEKTQEAIDVTKQVISEAVNKGFTANELALTKDSLINSFPTSFVSNAAMNATLGMMGFYRLPDTYLTDYVNRVQNADLNTVNQSYNSVIQPNKFLIVTVGNDNAKTYAKKTVK